MLFSILLILWLKKGNIAATWWKNIITKNLQWLKKTTKLLRTLLNVVSVTMIMLIDVKVRDHCRITGKYWGSAHRDCNINVKLDYTVPVVFHNLKNDHLHFIMEELGKFNLKVNVIPNGLGKCMSFIINSKLSFIDCFQFLSSQLYSLVKNLGKDDLKHFSQEFDNNVLDLVK